MLRNPEFDFLDMYPDLHKSMHKAIQDGRIRCFNVREGPIKADGNQGLNFWTCEIEDVMLDIMADPIFKGNPNDKSEMDLNEVGLGS